MPMRLLLFVLTGMFLAFAGAVSLFPAPARAGDMTAPVPTTVEGFAYDREFFPGAAYDPSIPPPRSLLGFAVGDRFASPEQITRCFETWSESSPRAELVEYARTYEGRPLNYLILSSPENLARVQEIQDGLARLADPRGLSDLEAERLLEEVPPVGWFGYSIHGNETSGADAALAVAYHLAAATDADTAALLDELVVIIDPMMNPDGRERFHQQTDEHRGRMPNLDSQSLIHRGYWPTGRVNHYLFDLNRDFIFGVHPETRGRIRAIGRWRPMLLVDGHEMGALDTYLFSPSTEPINPHFPERRDHWNRVFARDQASAFDRFGWPYYHGEWNDEWYPGYSAWAAFRGSLFILYEQARISEDAVRRREGTLLSYRESVHHQVVSTMANLQTLQRHGREMLREFLAERRAAVSSGGPYAGRTFAVLPSANGGRIAAFLDALAIQGIEVFAIRREITADRATDQLGRQMSDVLLPAGTLLVPNRQPEAHLVAAMLDFDPRMNEPTLRREREELLREGDTRMYDVTAWNITMLFGLEALTLPSGLPDGAEPVDPSDHVRSGAHGTGDGGTETAESAAVAAGSSDGAPGSGGAAVAWAIDGADDRSVAAAARLMERGVRVRAAERPFTFDGRDYARGSVLVTRNDNRLFDGNLRETVEETASALGMTPAGIRSGLGEGDLPDLGGHRFWLLEAPRIALFTRGGISAYDFGTIWFALDRKLGIRHTHLDETRINSVDFRRYNVIVLPDRWWGRMPPELLERLKRWVENGGTLIAIGRSAKALATEEAGLSRVRLLPDVLDRLEQYEVAVLREWLARTIEMPGDAEIWSHTAVPGLDLPWDGRDTEPPATPEMLAKRDEWLKLFMPQGAFLASRVDEKSWLTFGSGEWLPVLAGGAVGHLPVLMAAGPVQAPVRFGYFSPLGDGAPAKGKERRGRVGSGRGTTGKSKDDGRGIPDSGEEAAMDSRVGWAPVPDGYELRLRMSGLLWPEAAFRLANAAAVSRERVGQGQVILFASSPFFRGAALGTGRLIMNAMVYGPGMGTRQPVIP